MINAIIVAGIICRQDVAKRGTLAMAQKVASRETIAHAFQRLAQEQEELNHQPTGELEALADDFGTSYRGHGVKWTSSRYPIGNFDPKSTD